MDINRASRALERTAQVNGVSVNQVYKEIEATIEEAMATSDPRARALWSKIPCAGDRPTPAELIAFLTELISQ